MRKIEDLQDRIVTKSFKLMYKKACEEQYKKDDRIISPRMREIWKLRDWYFEEKERQ